MRVALIVAEVRYVLGATAMRDMRIAPTPSPHPNSLKYRSL